MNDRALDRYSMEPIVISRAAASGRWLPWCQIMRGIALLALLGSGGGCSLDGLLNGDELPKTVSDPVFTETPDGARAAYIGTVAQFREAFGGSRTSQDGSHDAFVTVAGLLSDELAARSTNEYGAIIDRRALPEGISGITTYTHLQKVRGQASQAIGLLNRHLPDQPAFVGRLYALQGYTEIALAELYCSGIPLSTLDFDGDFTYKPPSRTEQVLNHALALFDTALVRSADSIGLGYLASVGQGRALLGLKNYAAAAAAVSGVPTEFQYDVTYAEASQIQNIQPTNFAGIITGDWWVSMADREGGKGLNYRTSDDPRTRFRTIVIEAKTFYHPEKYDTKGATPIVLASGVEARLIEAEAAWQANAADPRWLNFLNALRTDGTFDVTATTPPDTLWHAGGGGVGGLRPLDDPGTSAAQVDLLFRERAFWLFLTGHRQGDMRRLIRQYGRTQDQVYPTGPYLGSLPYESHVTVPVPPSERVNPLYTGCISRDA